MAVADSLEPDWRLLVEARKITDLRTNELRSTAEILAQPKRCTAHFSADRWQSFVRDVSWFRGRQAPPRWAELSADHGYNATPVWTLLGHRLTHTGPASQRQILLLTLLDPLYFLALVAVALWAFDWRATAVALTNHLGLRMVLTYHPDEVGRKLVLKAPAEPWRLWKEARSRAWRVVWPVAVVVALGFGALLTRTLRHPHEPWVALALGSLVIPFVVDLTGYYYVFLLVPAFLWTLHRRVASLLLGLSAFTTFLSLAPLSFMSTWHDEQYTLISLATLLIFVACLLTCGRPADSTSKPAPAG